jgi:hypothetical protein
MPVPGKSAGTDPRGGRARLVVGMSGSSAPQLGAAFLRAARGQGGVETHFVLSAGARRSIELELRTDPAEIEKLADVVYDAADLGAAISARPGGGGAGARGPGRGGRRRRRARRTG